MFGLFEGRKRGPDTSGYTAEQGRIMDDLEGKIPTDFTEAELAQFSPEELAAMQVGPSAMDGVTTDPRMKQAQMSALQGLMDRGQSGYNVEDMAAIRSAQGESAMAERGSRNAILQNAEARGAGGSGMEMAAQLSNQQAAASRNAQSGLDIAAQGRQRALQAMMESGRMAGSMRTQDFGEQSAKAQAKDAIAQFNARALAGAYGQNLGNRQQVNNTNATGQNAHAQATYQNQAGVGQQRYNSSVNGQNAVLAKHAAKEKARAATDGAVIGAAGTVAGAMVGGPAGAAAGGALANAAVKKNEEEQY